MPLAPTCECVPNKVPFHSITKMCAKWTRNCHAGSYLKHSKRACFPSPSFIGRFASKARNPCPGLLFETKRPEFPPAFCIRCLKPLALRELEAAAGFGLAVFFTFNSTAVTCKEATLFEGWAQVWLKMRERTGNAVAHGTGLP